jgi:hypothetical protein
MAQILGELTNIQEKKFERDGVTKMYWILSIGKENKQDVTVWDEKLMSNLQISQKLKVTYEMKGQYKNASMIELAQEGDFETGSQVEEKEVKRGTTHASKQFNQDFLVDIKGKKFVRFNGLLDMATSKDLKDMVITQMSVSPDGLSAWCIGYVEYNNGNKTYSSGSANPDTLKPQLKGYAVEMASTRCFARALRNSLNVDFVSVEEMGMDESIKG